MNSINVERDINIHLENKGVSRRFFVYIFLVYALVCMTKNCFNGALADIVENGVLTKSQTGLITAMFYIIYTPFQIVGGIVVDKFSPERMIKIGLLGGAIANTVIFFNHNYYVMLIVWTLNAVVQFGLWPATFKIISSQLCRSDRSYMFLFITLASSLGLFFSYAVAAIAPSWEYNFGVSAAVLFVSAAGLHIYDRRVGRFMKPDYISETSPDTVATGPKSSTFSILWKSGFFMMLITILGYSVVSQSTKTLFPVMLLETYGKSAAFGNLLNTLIVISGIVGVLLLKTVIFPRLIKNEIIGILFVLALATAFCAILVVSPGLSVMVITLCAISMTTSMPSLLVSHFNARYIKYGKNGAAAGISNASSALGYAISSYVIVKISELYDWQAVKIVWLVMGIISVISTVLLFVIFRRFEKAEQKQK